MCVCVRVCVRAWVCVCVRAWTDGAWVYLGACVRVSCVWVCEVAFAYVGVGLCWHCAGLRSVGVGVCGCLGVMGVGVGIYVVCGSLWVCGLCVRVCV